MLIGAIRTRFAISRLCREVRRQADLRVANASVIWMGVYWIHPKHLALIIRVRTDLEKKKLAEDQTLRAAVKAALSNVNYPEEGRQGVSLDVESCETVDRDFQGSWYYRLK